MLPVTATFTALFVMRMLTHNPGFSRIGPKRELKKALE